MFRTKLLAVFAAVALAFPAWGETLRIDGFDPDQRNQILRAVKEAKIIWGIDFQVVEQGPAAKSINAHHGHGGFKAGLTVGPVVVIFLGSKATLHDLCGIALHEIGHLMGKPHTDSGIMAANYSPHDHRCN